MIVRLVRSVFFHSESFSIFFYLKQTKWVPEYVLKKLMHHLFCVGHCVSPKLAQNL